MKHMEEQFLKLHQYLEQRFDATDKVLAAKADASSLEAVRNAIDGLYGRLDVVESELTAVISHVRRLDTLVFDHEVLLQELVHRT
jgi:hypothetical protein